MTAPTELEQAVAKVESLVAALGQALRAGRAGRADAVEIEAAELQHALAAAMDRRRRSARSDPLSQPLRQRLARASGQVAAQRESLARASAALARALDVLLPAAPGAAVAYAADGRSARRSTSGLLRA